MQIKLLVRAQLIVLWVFKTDTSDISLKFCTINLKWFNTDFMYVLLPQYWYH